MTQQFKPDFLLHGGDYNYEQWLDYPEVLSADFDLMRQAHCNAMSVGIFSWSMLEPREGEFDFAWLDTLLDRLHANGSHAILATPSGSKPAWLSRAYPEVCRVDAHGRREPHQTRHNHCPTSPIFRAKVRIINTRLAERYADHPALLLWHVSNEYNGGGCHCDHCYAAFRNWLKQRYGTLDALNHAWWTTFWSHRFTEWEQIEPVDESIHGLMLDWKRFVSDQVIAFYLAEVETLRQFDPHTPATHNYMLPDVGLDYWELAKHVDVISWDSYPRWHSEPDDVGIAAQIGFLHDMHRAYKQQPFLLLESTPSAVNWQGKSRPKKPNMHMLSSLQAVAHGANGVNYFQWRKGRGGWEKYHGAVVGHDGTTKTRVFQDVAAVGKRLSNLAAIRDGMPQPEAAIIYDLQNGWALELAQLQNWVDKNYQAQCMAHYRPIWENSISADVIDSSRDFAPYKLLIAPMLYMLRDGVAQRLNAFVKAGGTLVLTYLSGRVNESDLTLIGKSPLADMLGLWVEETDTLFDHTMQSMTPSADNELGLDGCFPVESYANIVHLTGATPLATFDHEYYAGSPAITVNRFGDGACYYIAGRIDQPSLTTFYNALIQQLGLTSVIDATLPHGVVATARDGAAGQLRFVMNCNDAPATVTLHGDYRDFECDEPVGETVELAPYGVRILAVGA